MPVIHTYTNKNLPPPSQVAQVRVLAGQKQQLGKTTSGTLDRIQKCLSRSQHPNTPEKEAYTAWLMASRLMTEHNITQADVLQAIADESKYAEVAGESVVAIKSTKSEGARLTYQIWSGDVAGAVGTLFDCKSYRRRGAVSIDWTFYGIGANTVAAAMAFEMAHNLIQDWSRNHKGAGAKHSYCLGISSNLRNIAREEKELEEKRTKEGTQKQGGTADGTWATHKALIQFRHSAEKVADEYLKAQNIRLGKGKRPTRNARNQAAYQAGVDDSKRINLKRKLIDDGGD